jgi:hypothetical protein
MIQKEPLKRVLALAAEEREMCCLIVVLFGGFGGTRRKQAIDDLSHILTELEYELKAG